MAGQNFYDILGVSKTASQDEIKSTFRKLARKYHPDVNPGDKKAEERFKSINTAFEILSDPEKRKLYDEFGEDAIKLGFDPEKARAYREWQHSRGQARGGPGFGGGVGFEEVFSGGGSAGFGDIFGDIFGRGARWRNAPQDDGQGGGGQDIEADLAVTFMEAALGAQKEIILHRPQAYGQTAKEVRLKVTIPKGINDGQKIRLAGQGYPGPRRSEPGDLLITVFVAKHALFRRDGNDIYLDVPVTVAEAMFGAKIDIPALEGVVKLTVPAGAQSGTRLRLKGKGITPGKNTSPGDMYVTLMVKVPEVGAHAEQARRACETIDGLYKTKVRAALRI